MNKTVIILFLITILISCSEKKENSSRRSTGKINVISVVIDDQLWNGVVGDSIRNKFANPMEGLPKEEPQFDINQYPTDVMEGFVTKSRTIIVVKIGKENSFAINKNEYATPQNVIHITGKSLSELLHILEKRTPQIINIIRKGEIKAHQLLLNDSLLDPKTNQQRFHLTLKIPNNYSYSIEKNNFVWLKKEFVCGSTSLLIAQLPISSIHWKENVLPQIIKIRDSMGALYIKGNVPASLMYIDKSYPLYVSKISLDGKVAYETKGTWRLQDSFMFGPFVNYIIVDPSRKRIVFLDGFCYAPSSDRRDFMHELESIIKGGTLN